MKSTRQCGLCEKETREDLAHGSVCHDCADVLEFGYPSFPAYRLMNGSAEKITVKYPNDRAKLISQA